MKEYEIICIPLPNTNQYKYLVYINMNINERIGLRLRRFKATTKMKHFVLFIRKFHCHFMAKNTVNIRNVFHLKSQRDRGIFLKC